MLRTALVLLLLPAPTLAQDDDDAADATDAHAEQADQGDSDAVDPGEAGAVSVEDGDTEAVDAPAASAPEQTAPDSAPGVSSDAPMSSALGVAAPGRERLLVLDLEPVGTDPNVVRVVNGLVADGLDRAESLEVITSGDLSAIVELEAERQALNCDTSSCLAEIAGAMGTRYVLFGTVGQLGSTTVVQMNLFDSLAAKPIGRREVRAQDAGELADPVKVAAIELVEPILKPDDPVRELLVVAPEPVPDDGPGGARIAMWSVGGVALAAGAVIGLAGTAWFSLATASLNGWAPSPAVVKNSVYKPTGLLGLAGPAMGLVIGIGGAVALGGAFLVE